MKLQEPWQPWGALDARPTLATLDTTPSLGRDFELVLLASKNSLSSARIPWQGSDAEAVIRDFLTCPDADFVALPLPNEDRVALDVFYVNNWSVWMDLYIFIATFNAVIFRRGAK